MKFKSILLFLTSCALLFVAFFLRDPVFLKFRYTGLIAINLIGVAWVILALRHPEKKHILSKLSIFIVLCSLAISTGKQLSFEYKKNFVLNYDKIKLSHFASHIIVGFRTEKELKELLQIPVLGFFVTHHNVKKLDLRKAKELMDEIQNKRKENIFPNALIASDQEGGNVSRLSPPLELQPSLGEIVAYNSDSDEILTQKINDYAEIQATELKKIGINLNFSPILDLKLEKEKNPLDLYSRIYKRAISSDPKFVSKVGEIYSKKLLEKKILPTCKHFPGIGRITEDTHFFNATISTPVKDLESSDLFPFLHIAHNIDYPIIMLSHSTVTDLDLNNPISMSEKGVQEYIRAKFPISTVLITDDMNMGPILYSTGGIGNASVKALNAGVDILLISYDGEQIFDALFALINAELEGKMNRNRILESEKRIKRLLFFSFPELETYK